MNHQQRTELLEVVGELGRKYPEWRFGQLIENIAGWADQPIWEMEDGQLLQAAQLHLRELSLREHQVRS